MSGYYVHSTSVNSEITMTTQEVSIPVTEMRTEEIHICDGCGEKVPDEHLVYGNVEDVWPEDEEKLHFCDEECRDSIRSTRVPEEEEVSRARKIGRKVKNIGRKPVDVAKSDDRGLLKPYNNTEIRPSFDAFMTIACFFLPFVGPAILLCIAHRRKCDHLWQAAWAVLLGQLFVLAIGNS